MKRFFPNFLNKRVWGLGSFNLIGFLFLVLKRTMKLIGVLFVTLVTVSMAFQSAMNLGFFGALKTVNKKHFQIAKKITYGEECRKKLVEGINIVANAMKSTLGPKDRNVMLENSYGTPEIVNDCVTIARDTSAQITQEIVNQAVRMVAAGANPVSLKNGFMTAARKLVDKVKEIAERVTDNNDLLAIATIASNSASMGKIIAQAYEKIGDSGSTIVEESQTLLDEIEFTEGLTIERGFVSPYFIKDTERQVSEFTNPRVLVTDKKIQSIQDLLPILEQLVKTKEALFIVADDITGEALSTLVVNKLRGVIDVCAIKAPSFGDRRKAYLQDIAIATGATYIADELGNSLESVNLSMLGTAERIVCGKESTTIVTDRENNEVLKDRIKQIRAELESTTNKFDKEKLQERAASLGGGIARIKVGAATEIELKDKKLRYEDALNSVKMTIKMGTSDLNGSFTHFTLGNETVLRQEIILCCSNPDDVSGAMFFLGILKALMKESIRTLKEVNTVVPLVNMNSLVTGNGFDGTDGNIDYDFGSSVTDQLSLQNLLMFYQNYLFYGTVRDIAPIVTKKFKSQSKLLEKMKRQADEYFHFVTQFIKENKDLEYCVVSFLLGFLKKHAKLFVVMNESIVEVLTVLLEKRYYCLILQNLCLEEA
jgi:chaperonin GroEL